MVIGIVGILRAINGAFQVDEGSGLQRVWNQGNDGSGSGSSMLILLMVYKEVSFLRSDTNDVLGGVLSYHSNDARLQFRNTSYNTSFVYWWMVKI